MDDILFWIFKSVLAAAFVALGLFWLISPYSPRARKGLLTLTRNKVVKDYGEISGGRLFGFWQSLRLLRAEKNEQFYVIESVNRRFVSLQPITYWLKLSDDSVKKLQDVLADRFNKPS